MKRCPPAHETESGSMSCQTPRPPTAPDLHLPLHPLWLGTDMLCLSCLRTYLPVFSHASVGHWSCQLRLFSLSRNSRPGHAAAPSEHAFSLKLR